MNCFWVRVLQESGVAYFKYVILPCGWRDKNITKFKIASKYVYKFEVMTSECKCVACRYINLLDLSDLIWLYLSRPIPSCTDWVTLWDAWPLDRKMDDDLLCCTISFLLCLDGLGGVVPYLYRLWFFIWRSQWPRGLRHRSAAARLLRLWVRIPPGAWLFVCCECCVLSGRGLCDELITCPEESYRLWWVVVSDRETSRMRRPWPALGHRATGKKKKKKFIYFS